MKNRIGLFFLLPVVPCAYSSSPVFHRIFAHLPADSLIVVKKTLRINAVSLFADIALQFIQSGWSEALALRCRLPLHPLYTTLYYTILT